MSDRAARAPTPPGPPVPPRPGTPRDEPGPAARTPRTFSEITGVEAATIDDPEALKALAHPLRLELLGALQQGGPATASALARALGETSGATSYHLRQLHRFGLVEPDPHQPSRRTKVWRSAERMVDVTPAAWRSDPAAAAAVGQVVRRQVDTYARHLATFMVEAPALPEWVDAAMSSAATVRLTAPMLEEMRRELLGVLGRWVARAGGLADVEVAGADAESREVAVYLGAVPVTEAGP